jgi:O-6-methylguanine DNA methyltransferase
VLTKAALESVLSGTSPGELPPLDISAGTDFQKRVWSALRRIPAGQTKSYSEIAAEIGSERAVRAVGRACGANPIPVLIPCHRVVASGGKLGGFSGGLDWKKRLLSIEGVLNGAIENAESQINLALV